MVSRCNAEDLISPINISKSNVASDCSLKCSLIENYNASSVNIHNKGTFLSMDYESNTRSNFHIKFNSIKMNVNEIRVYFPSIHSYNSSKADGELLIIHNGNGSNCIISIPIIGKSSSTNGEKTLSTIFDNVKSNIPNKNESSSLNISNFNLSKLLPLNVPYYYYQGQLVFNPCTQNYNYIVYDKKDYSIHIDETLLKEMKVIFKQTTNSVSSMKNLKNLSYNKKGATNVELMGTDDIYIDCKPVNTIGGADNAVDSSNNDIQSLKTSSMRQVETQKPNISFDDIAKNPAFDVVISFIGLFILYTGGKYALSYIQSRRN